MKESLELHPLYASAIAFVLIFSLVGFCILLFISAPYGKHFRPGWGPSLNARFGWLLMEAPAPIGFFIVYWQTPNAWRDVPLTLASLYLLHYLYRSFIYPFRMRASHKSKPVLTIALAFVFNCVNGPANAYAIGALAPHLLEAAWLSDPRFVIGIGLFGLGYGINHHSDAILRSLRKPGEDGYKIPQGGMYRWISSPNYFGEIIEWCGFALAAWTLAAFAFALFTIANLVPRALSNHRWYLEHFDDYPSSRKAVFPSLL